MICKELWTDYPETLNSAIQQSLLITLARGPVVQFGMNAAFARRRSRVQIPPGPQFSTFHSRPTRKSSLKFQTTKNYLAKKEAKATK
jgi:hypothetical protein